MPILTRNVTGEDILSIRTYIEERGPVERDAIVAKYFPDDEKDPENSKKTKLIRDAIDFLNDVELIEKTEEGYTAVEFPDQRSEKAAVLRAIRQTAGEESAYNVVLEYLIQDDLQVFDSTDQLKDGVSEYASEFTWTETNLSYWVRVLETIGVVKTINSDTDNDTLLSLDDDFLYDVLNEITDSTEAGLLETLRELEDTYLPVFTPDGKVAAAHQGALGALADTGRIELDRQDDGGPELDIRDSPMNRVSIN